MADTMELSSSEEHAANGSTNAAVVNVDAPASRAPHPRRLALALIGELHRGGDSGPYLAVTLIGILEEAGVSAPAARAALDRFVLRGLLARERIGRGISYRLTPSGEQVIAEGAARVHADAPFTPRGEGWTIVTFSVPEGRRGLRHRLRSALTWSGFAPLRDGVWIAAGERDPVHTLDSLEDDLKTADIVAFHAHDLHGFPMVGRVADTWDLDAVRAEHESFLERWARADADLCARDPLAAMTLLVADWLELLRNDPSLPARYLGRDWPATRSHAAYLARRAEFAKMTEEQQARRG